MDVPSIRSTKSSKSAESAQSAINWSNKSIWPCRVEASEYCSSVVASVVLVAAASLKSLTAPEPNISGKPSISSGISTVSVNSRKKKLAEKSKSTAADCTISSLPSVCSYVPTALTTFPSGKVILVSSFWRLMAKTPASARVFNSPSSLTPLLLASCHTLRLENSLSLKSIRPSVLLSKSANASKPLNAKKPSDFVVLSPNSSLPLSIKSLPFLSNTNRPSSGPIHPVPIFVPSLLWSKTIPSSEEIVSTPSPSRSRARGSRLKRGGTQLRAALKKSLISSETFCASAAASPNVSRASSANVSKFDSASFKKSLAELMLSSFNWL